MLDDTKKLYDKLPRGSRTAMARDIGYTMVAVTKSVFGYVENEDIDEKVTIWLSIMGKIRAAPTYRENLYAQQIRKILFRSLVIDSTSYILVRDVIGFLYENHYETMAVLSNQRIYAIIACNFPLEEHIEGESIIGYRIDLEA